MLSVHKCLHNGLCWLRYVKYNYLNMENAKIILKKVYMCLKFEEDKKQSISKQLKDETYTVVMK